MEYVVSVPEPEHRYLRVSAEFPAAPGQSLDIRMSRTSPGRYALHEFAKNVFGEEASGANGQPLPLQRTGLDRWTVVANGDTIRFSYNLYGDTLNGTHVAVDESHAHLNAPATFVWARGLEDAPARIRFEQPAGRNWRAFTQLYPTADPLVFTAPNLVYLMDSPVEFSDATVNVLRLGVNGQGGATATVRIARHEVTVGDDPEDFLDDIERVILEEREVFGELPDFEPGSYTFLADYLPWAQGDAMEHRNSSVLTSPAPASFARLARLDTIAHEFFHVWNVERIRPLSLEPFDFTEANVSSDLWLAEGFTNYYAPLILRRAGFTSTEQWLGWMAGVINEVTQSPARRVRSVAEVSALAPFADGAQHADRTVLSNTYLSYYTWGSAVALGLDLSLRDHSDGARSLDDFMRVLWTRHGKPGGRVPGVVDRPYVQADLVAALATVAGDSAFAQAFFDRFITGRDVPPFGMLLARAGLQLRPARPGQSWAGSLELSSTGADVRLEAPPPMGTPAWNAGLAQDDVLIKAGNTLLDSPGAWSRVLAGSKPGAVLPIEIQRRGQQLVLPLRVAENPDIEIVRIERTGGRLTPDQEAFRRAWMESKVVPPAR